MNFHHKQQSYMYMYTDAFKIKLPPFKQSNFHQLYIVMKLAMKTASIGTLFESSLMFAYMYTPVRLHFLNSDTIVQLSPPLATVPIRCKV